MKLIILLVTFGLTNLCLARGAYSDEDYVICDVDVRLWPKVQRKGYLEVAPGAPDPFIHCARPSQLYDVMNKYFAGTTQVLLVTLVSEVSSIVRYENNYPRSSSWMSSSTV